MPPVIGGQYAGVAAAAVVMFAGTNIDDAAVLAVLNVAARSTGSPTHRQIWAGQYLGMALMVAVSMVGALGLSRVSGHWVGLLGLVPIALGIRLLYLMIRDRAESDRPPPTLAAGLLSVTGMTVATGGDNIAVYTAAFRFMRPGALALTVAVFAVATALWCAAGFLLISRPALAHALRRWGSLLVPPLLIGLGAHILLYSQLI